MKKKTYIVDYWETENIRLDKAKICKNSGLRSIAKLCLNSFWGKSGQRDNLLKTEVIKTREQLLAYLTNYEIKVSSLLFINDQLMYISHKNIKDVADPSPITNVVIAAYTTAQARL